MKEKKAPTLENQQQKGKERTFAEPMSFILAASLIAFCTFFSSLCISKLKPKNTKK